MVKAFLGGYKEASLVDVPGRVSIVLFTAGCNFRCPFCHNANLVLPEQLKHVRPVGRDFILNKIKKLSSRKVIDAVAITGGEPLMWQQLSDLLKAIREIDPDLFIKVDTNGSFPKVLQSLINDSLVDYVAMDIKTSPSKYLKAIGLPKFDLNKIRESIKIIKTNLENYEFRTTVVPTLVERDDFEGILSFVHGAKLYALQSFYPRTTLDPSYAMLKPTDSDFLAEMERYFKPYVRKVEVRQ